ncbi:MAG: hypothetical protein ACXABY_36100, partial [Candidatus Thorarchaeota archaeon]
MANEIRKEPFIGAYDGVTPSVLLPKGSTSDGKNIRKVSRVGGWKGRKGCALHNTTAVDSFNGVKSLHQYTNPIQDDYHFIAQCNSLLYDSTKDPPDITGTTGTDPAPSGFFSNDTSESTIGDFLDLVTDQRSDTVGRIYAAADDYFIVITPEIAEGIKLNLVAVNSNNVNIRVSAWQTDNYVPAGGVNLVSATYKWSASGSGTNEFYCELAGGGDPSLADPVDVMENYSYISEGTMGSLSASEWDYGDNDSLGYSTIYIRLSDDADPDSKASGYVWSDGADLTDGTDSSGTLAQDGTISWTRSVNDTLTSVGNRAGYAYKVSWSGALSGAVTVEDCTVKMDASLMSNKWDGTWEWVTGCWFYDGDEFLDVFGKISNESESQYMDLSLAETDEYVYIKTPEPAAGFGFGVIGGKANSANAQIDSIEALTGEAWTEMNVSNDTTLDPGADSSFSQTGKVFGNPSSVTAVKSELKGGGVAGYWYRVSWDATLSDDVHIYALFYAAHPNALPVANGCIEFKGRLFIWEPDENRLHFSTLTSPDSFSGVDSGYTDSFGGKDEIIHVAKFYNELVVFKKNSVWLLEGYSPATFGILQISSTVGLASPMTAKAAE